MSNMMTSLILGIFGDFHYGHDTHSVFHGLEFLACIVYQITCSEESSLVQVDLHNI